MAWANSRLLSAASELTSDELEHDFKTSEHCVRSTLAHIYRAERVWLGRMEGKPVAFQVEGDDTIAALSVNWPQLDEGWLQWSRTLTDQDALAELTYHDLKGNPWTQTIWQIMHHVVNHSTHHRGQAIGFIRALGHTPPNVDSITFARQQK
jgi:uncharacterized damage-inducible protein DinB